MPIIFSTIKTLPEIVKILKGFNYELTFDGEIKKENGLYHKLSTYTREEDGKKDEVKVHQKYSDEKDIGEFVPLAKRTLEYEGGLRGLGELKEEKLDE